ncbi:MAG: alpha/beta hydrolase [Desulfomonilia bacterium]|jgi:pimeloyl-ACP methyl ester carboxylesterase
MAERMDIEFPSGGTTCRGWYYPAPASGDAPCVILAHGFCGVKEMRLDKYAEAFADAGYHAVVFDYRHFGASDGEPRQILDLKKQHQDWHSALKFARGLPRVDRRRIVLWGTSFSGGHVAAVAHEDGDIAAVISQVPHLNGLSTALATGPLQGLRLGRAAILDTLRALVGMSPYYVRACGAPGELAAMTAPDAEEGMRRLLPEGFTPDERVAARIFLRVGIYSPGRLAPRIRVPWLVQAASRDLTTPLGPAIKAALKAPRGQLIIYQCGHFDVYVEPRFSQTVGDQLTFLKNNLPA